MLPHKLVKGEVKRTNRKNCSDKIGTLGERERLFSVLQGIQPLSDSVHYYAQEQVHLHSGILHAQKFTVKRQQNNL